MKVIFSCLLATGLLFLLTGCGSKDESLESIDSISAETPAKISHSSTEEQSVFQGDIESITESDETTIQIKVVNVKEIEDPENIGTSFSNDGVTLNASNEQLEGGKEAFQKGDQVEFILTEKPMMTMSIPPQIPGHSIIKISVIE
jgi:hypothetical protein